MNNKKEFSVAEDIQINKKITKKDFFKFLAVLGPGITVMLADTDSGSIVTAAQSGAQWGYKLILINVLLIPILYFVQELTTRIGVTTGKGHGELIRDKFGKKWATLSIITLFISTIGALITEFSGLIGVGLLFGVSKWIMVPLSVGFLILISTLGKYRRVEKIAILVGVFELVFIGTMIWSKPDYLEVAKNAVTNQPLGNLNYWYLISATVGAVIMPWMVFYQQGAVVDKKMKKEDLKSGKIDTFIGSIITQVIVIAVIITVAGTIGKTNPNESLNTIQQISDALTPFLGATFGKIVFAIGISGAALIAAIVVSLASSWGFGELINKPCSLDNKWKEAPAFYAFYCGIVIVGGIIVLSGVPLVPLTIGVEILNTLLLPIVLGFLLALAWKVLPKEFKLKKWEKVLLVLIYVAVVILSLFTLYITIF